MSVSGVQMGMSAFWYQSAVYAPRHAATTAAVEPVAKAPAVEQGSRAKIYAPAAQAAESRLPEIRQGADPVEMAVRGRIQYLSEEEIGGLLQNNAAESLTAPGAEQAEPSLSEVLEEGECQTCEERKYQDGSNDPGVSFKTATKLSPEKAATAVRGHEYEHVVRDQAKAEREGREVVQQSVTLHNEICPECGKVYVAGGETRTVTRAKPQEQKPPASSALGFEAVA